jgi:hypothetical protein
MRRPLRLLNLLMMVLLAASVVACEKKEDDDDDDDNNINQSPTVTSVTRSQAFTVVGLGGAINLSAQATDPDGDSLTYTWEVTTTGADGVTGADGGRPLVTYTGQNVSHTAAGSGVQTATATVSDGNGGTGSASVQFVTTDINGNWEVRIPSLCGAARFVMNFTRNGGNFSGNATFPETFCAAAAGSTGQTDPAVPATINAAGQIFIRFKVAIFLDFLFNGQIDTTTGRIINGNVTQGGFAGEAATLTRQ